MDDLKRDLAPLTELAWTEMEEEARRTLKRTLAARKLVDFTGPLGWSVSSIGLGRKETVTPPQQPAVRAALRTTQPLVELLAPFVVSLRGGDFELSVGRDFSIGYSNHTDTAVHLYLQESFTFRVLAPEAAVPLAYT